MSKLRCLDLTGKLIALFILFLYYKSITNVNFLNNSESSYKEIILREDPLDIVVHFQNSFLELYKYII